MKGGGGIEWGCLEMSQMCRMAPWTPGGVQETFWPKSVLWSIVRGNVKKKKKKKGNLENCPARGRAPAAWDLGERRK